MANFLFSAIDFSLKWIIPLVTYIMATIYAVIIVGETEKKLGAIIWGFLLFAGLIVIVIVSGLEDLIPSIELKEYPLLVVFSMIFGILAGVLFVIIVENRMKYPENLLMAATIALSFSSLFLHLYIFQIRIVLGAIMLGCLIGVFGKLYAVGSTKKIGGGRWRGIYNKKN